ncbi:DinB family protein [Halobacillus sp. A1]|uniref:DinB family protein n=1 Tax=Halobacillus sp. A1 TaxID=2880262 RepID=UPI0020A67830|nr:DinB family protein [Halobacillus sp. A1]MCP3030887.1 DinB family protein [Halobacillus sp. A1]
MSKNAHFIDHFLSHREVTKELISKIDSDHYSYKPTPTSMEAEKLVNHILESMYSFARFANKQQPEKLFGEGDTSDLVKRADIYTEETVKLISSLSDEDFEQMIDVSQIFGKEVSAGQLLTIAVEHEIHHKGNLFVYVREMGHTELPLYIKS